jgi:hypothetical protein
MPLSDREQKILSDIEARLRADDPKFAKTVSTTTVSTHVRRQIKLAVAGFALGFLLLLLFIVDFWFGVAGFALMLVSAVHGGNQLKRLGAGQDGGTGGQLRGGLNRYLNDRRDRGDDLQH